MELGPATVRVLVVVAVCVQTRAWGRIGHPLVEVADFLAPVHLGPPRISGLSARSTSSATGGRPKACRPKPNAGSVHSGGGFVHHPQRVVEGEGVRLLNRREVLEGRR